MALSITFCWLFIDELVATELGNNQSCLMPYNKIMKVKIVSDYSFKNGCIFNFITILPDLKIMLSECNLKVWTQLMSKH